MLQSQAATLDVSIVASPQPGGAGVSLLLRATIPGSVDPGLREVPDPIA